MTRKAKQLQQRRRGGTKRTRPEKGKRTPQPVDLIRAGLRAGKPFEAIVAAGRKQFPQAKAFSKYPRAAVKSVHTRLVAAGEKVPPLVATVAQAAKKGTRARKEAAA